MAQLYRPTFRHSNIATPDISKGAALIIQGLGTPGQLVTEQEEKDRLAAKDALEKQKWDAQMARWTAEDIRQAAIDKRTTPGTPEWKAAKEAEQWLALDTMKKELEHKEKNDPVYRYQLEQLQDATALKLEKEAFQKAISSPEAYGLIPGTQEVIDRLGQLEPPQWVKELGTVNSQGQTVYTPEERKRLDAWGDQISTRMQELGRQLTSDSLEDVVTSYAAINPENRAAQEEALKVRAARQNALDTSAKAIADRLADLQLKRAELSVKPSSGTTGKTTGGASIKDPGDVYASGIAAFKKAHGLDTKAKLPPEASEYASMLANEGYDAAQIAQLLNQGYTGRKSRPFWFDTDAKFTPTEEQLAMVGAPRNISTEAGGQDAYIDMLGQAEDAYKEQLSNIQDQRTGKVGLDELRNIISNMNIDTNMENREIVKKVVEEIAPIEGTKKEVTKEVEKAVEEVVEKEVEKAVKEKKEISIFRQKANEELDKKHKKGELTPLENTQRQLGIHPDQLEAKRLEANERIKKHHNEVRRKHVEKLNKKLAEEAKINKYINNPEVLEAYNSAWRTANRRAGRLSTGYRPFSLKEFILENY